MHDSRAACLSSLQDRLDPMLLPVQAMSENVLWITTMTLQQLFAPQHTAIELHSPDCLLPGTEEHSLHQWLVQPAEACCNMSIHVVVF